MPLLAVGQRSLCYGLLCLLCVSGPNILRRSLYRATANYEMGYPLVCENELPVTLLTLKLVTNLLGGRALIPEDGGEGGEGRGGGEGVGGGALSHTHWM